MDQGALLYDWKFWSRPQQRAPEGDWFVWLVQAGRGFGKTRAGAEYIRGRVDAGAARRIALVNDTSEDTRKIMIEGPAGLLAISPPWDRPEYIPSKKELHWKNGAVAHCYEAEAPEKLRGPEHDLAWADEPAKWRNLRKADVQGATAWDNLLLGLRQGTHPQLVATTTPRPLPWLRALKKLPTTVVTRGSSYENDELAAEWFSTVVAPYEGTRLGRQELYAEDLDDTPGALWTLARIDALRVLEPAPACARIVVALDPSGGIDDTAAECGIVVAGVGLDGHGYVLADRSLRGTPEQWAQAAVSAYRAFQADRVVAEVNFGGAMVGATLRTIEPSLPYRELRASRGKIARAEPISALYEQGRIHHVGAFPALEDQMVTYVPDLGLPSPDRMDAMVWALTDLMLDERGIPRMITLGSTRVIDPWGPGPDEAARAAAAEALRVKVLTGGYWPQGR
jgi:phage terminase large subunit-like protein